MFRTIYVRVILVFLLIASASFAQNNRSAVSVNGSDANPCTTVSPCRSFGIALAHTNAGGEVIALDSGGYGAFTISQPVSVIGAPGIHAALTATSGDGIDVTAGASDIVRIINLRISILATSGYGIHATGFGSLTIDNCTVSGGLHSVGISGPSSSRTYISDTVVRAADNVGYYFESAGSLVRARAEGCGNAGLYLQNGAVGSGVVSAVEYVGVGNTYGVSLYTSIPGPIVKLNLDRALIANNSNDGILTYAVDTSTAAVGVSNSMITDNGGYGFHQTGSSTFGTMKNNLVTGNFFGPSAGSITTLQAN